MGLLDMWSLILANWLNSGNFSKRGKISASDIIADYNLIFTRSKVKKVFRITGIKPENVDISFVDYLREKMFDLNPDVECDVSMTCFLQKSM